MIRFKFLLLSFFFFNFCMYINAQNYPFPQQVNYTYGIKPNSQTQAVMNSDVQAKFVQWRSVFVTSSGCPTAGTKRIVQVNNSNYSCSEGISYGLMILVYMDNATNNTKADFDAILGYYKSYLNTQGLMKWQIDASGNPTGTTFAGDGDELVAFACLMADKQWGSTGTINYLAEAVRVIKQLELYNVQSNKTFADGGGGWIFPAYQMPYAMKEFGVVNSNTAGWNATVAKAYSLFNNFYVLNSTTGLMYDTCTPAYAAVDAAHSYYGYDACRVPWQLGLEYVWNGTASSTLSKDHPTKIANWAKTAWSSNPSNAKQKYNMNGTVPAGTNPADYGSMVGPIMVGAMTSTDQTWLNILYGFCRSLSVGSNYFADNILMINMIIATGNMPNFRNMSVYTKVDNPKSDSNVTIYPNPTDGQDLNINLNDFKKAEETTVEIYNLQGKKQYSKSFNDNNIVIPKSKLQEGIFIITVKNNNQTVTKRIIIQ